MKITATEKGILSHKADALVIAIGDKNNTIPTRFVNKCSSTLKSLLKSLPKGQSSLTVLSEIPAYKYLHLIDCSKKSGDAFSLAKKIKATAKSLASFECKSIVVDLDGLSDSKDVDAVLIAAQTFGTSSYKFNLGNKIKPGCLATVTLVTKTKPALVKRSLKVGNAIADGMNICRHLSEQPPNLLYPEVLAREAKKHATAAGLKVKVLDEKQLAKLKMNGLLAVGKASTHPPRLIEIRHNGGPKNAAPIALVGKGITFDTGGNSLKPSNAMVDMKYDMCGAASVIGTMIACAKMKLPLNVVAVVPSAENMVAGNAFRPDDILTMMDGQTVEVLNTDAEGRLILADALTYTQKILKPKAIIDAATLTGACLVALGEHRCGLMSNNDALANALSEAGDNSGDVCWRLPLDDAYDQVLRTDFADVCNIGGGRNAGTITAACFLGRFVNKKVPWAHLDIAGSAWQNRRASGRPVPLFVTFLAKKAKLI